MLNKVTIEAINPQGVLLKRSFICSDLKGANFSGFFREILEEIGLDTAFFVVNATFETNTMSRACVIGHYIVENGMLVPVSANAFRTLWEVRA
ncbi:MAG: hypothetical protein [Microviridae sp.]|nr:MAG: hypothetical protein [Microviridae sp.]